MFSLKRLILVPVLAAALAACTNSGSTQKYEKTTTPAQPCVRNGRTIALVSMTTNDDGKADSFMVDNKLGQSFALTADSGNVSLASQDKVAAGKSTVFTANNLKHEDPVKATVTIYSVNSDNELCRVTLTARPKPVPMPKATA